MRSSFVRRMRAHGSHESEMPLRGYILSVGGALLTLLFAADWLMARPAPNGSINSHSELPVIRIHSELKGPDAVVIKTNQPTILPVSTQLTGEYGIRNTCTSIPTTIARAGIIQRHEIELWPREVSAIQAGAKQLDATYAQVQK